MTSSKAWILILLWGGMGLLPGGAYAQNKLVVRDFRWQIVSVPHFDIYYYDQAGRSLLPYADRYLENAYRKATRVLPATLEKEIPFFLYNDHNEFEQTNVVDVGEGTGGVTEAFKNRFLVGHIGSQRYLEYVITHEFVHEIEFEYLFSGFWRSVRIIKIIIYPNWLLEGLAEFVGGPMDATTREMYLRDAVLNKKLFPLEQLYNFSHVMPHQVTLAYKESEALMYYIADEYGVDKLPLLLTVYREHFDANAVLLLVLGTDLPTLDKRFREYMEDKYTRAAQGLEEPGVRAERLVPSDKSPYPRFYTGGTFSPDAKNVAYISDERGGKEIYLFDRAAKTSARILGLAGVPRVNNVYEDGFGLAWSKDGKLIAFAGERQQKDYLYVYDLSSRRLSEIDTRTQTVASPAFSPDGSTIYFSGMENGFRNIYSRPLSGGDNVQLTTGHMDKIDAQVSPDGKWLAFAEERESASGRVEYDLRVMDIAAKESFFITALTGDERYPAFSPDGETLYFTSDQDGINNIYSIAVKKYFDDNAAANDAPMRRLTNVIGGNFQPRLSGDGRELMFSSYRNSSRELYIMQPGTASVVSVPAQARVTRASPDAAEEPPPAPAAARPYRFKVSTDLFYPVLFYSSVDGLYVATYWQLSEFLGNHRLQSLVTYASGASYLDYQLTYAYLRFRPQFYLSAVGNEYFVDFSGQQKQKQYQQSLTTLYPLNHFDRVGLLISTTERREIFSDTPELNTRVRDNVAGLSFMHDTVQGPYLEATSGWRLLLSGDVAEKIWGGDLRYQDLIAETNQFFPLGKEHVLGLRSVTAGSFGPDAGYFRLGGADRVRGIPAETLLPSPYLGRRLFLTNAEWRFPLVYNINYHMWYFFPDFFFKTMYGTLFTDAGLVWNEDSELETLTHEQWKGSCGAGLRVHTFILQTYPLLLNIQYARRMDGPFDAWYFTLSSNF